MIGNAITANMNTETMQHGERILAVLPMPYSDDGGFWFRDVGLIVMTLREMGCDAWLVAFGDSVANPSKMPVILVSGAELVSPEWWQQQKPWAAILNLWRATRYENIRKSARMVTSRLIEKADSDGVISPRIWLQDYWKANYVSAKDSKNWRTRHTAILGATVRTSLLWFFPGLLDRKLARSLSSIPIMAAESPLAVERLKRFVSIYKFPLSKIICIPHPVDLGDLDTGLTPVRENKIVSIGRWDACQKNFPLLLRVLADFLAEHPKWTAEVIGRLPKNLSSLTKRISPDVLSRIKLSGPVPHSDLGICLKSAKVFLMSSRHESFNIAAAEALCCGCTIAGPIDIASISFFTNAASGTAACRPSRVHLLDALSVETTAWSVGKRDPSAIATFWRNQLSAKSIADEMLKAFRNIQVDS